MLSLSKHRGGFFSSLLDGQVGHGNYLEARRSPVPRWPATD
jgi:hypothetical protein